MTPPSSRIGALLFASLAIAACGGSHTPDVPCVGKTPPLGAPTVRLRLSRLEVGDRDSSGKPSRDAWRTLGYDLDGRCTTRNDVPLCHRRAGASPSNQEDGTDGIDNAFGKVIVPFAAVFFAHPSAAWSGESYLEIDGDGSGMLSLVDPASRSWIRVPFVDARAEISGGSGTLGAIIPTDGLIALFRRDAGTMSAQLCRGSTVDSIIQTIKQASDMSLSGHGDPDVDCDGVSMGIVIEGSPVDAIPPAPPSVCDDVERARTGP